MKKTILLSVIVLSCVFSLMAQAPPQAFNYSSVIRGSNGQALPNKVVALQFTILSGSPLGNVEYQETHLDTTDQWGVVNLAIGTGTVQQGNFSSIDWGINTYYLQVELDENGGTNFQMMGTLQLLSVPYALYAEKASSIDTLSATINSNLFFPDGVNGTPVIIFPDSSYTVPLGKTLYITFGISMDMNIFLASGIDTFYIANRAIITEGTTITASSINFFSGILVDIGVEAVNLKTKNFPYTVPTGKTLYLVSFAPDGDPQCNQINGIPVPLFSNSLILTFQSGTIIQRQAQNCTNNRNWIFTGYLK